MTTINISKPYTIRGVFELSKDRVLEDGKAQWSKWINAGIKDATPINEWSYVAQLMFAKSFYIIKEIKWKLK